MKPGESETLSIHTQSWTAKYSDFYHDPLLYQQHLFNVFTRKILDELL